MDGRISCPDFEVESRLIPEIAHRTAFFEAIKEELLWCAIFAQSAASTSIRFHPFRETPRQLILEFEVLDLDKPRENGYNWHGQNTSQWLYAGAIVYDRETGRVSRHH